MSPLAIMKMVKKSTNKIYIIHQQSYSAHIYRLWILKESKFCLQCDAYCTTKTNGCVYISYINLPYLP